MRVTVGVLEAKIWRLNKAVGGEYSLGGWSPSVGVRTRYWLQDEKNGCTVGSGTYTTREIDAMIDGLLSTRDAKSPNRGGE